MSDEQFSKVVAWVGGTTSGDRDRNTNMSQLVAPTSMHAFASSHVVSRKSASTCKRRLRSAARSTEEMGGDELGNEMLWRGGLSLPGPFNPCRLSCCVEAGRVGDLAWSQSVVRDRSSSPPLWHSSARSAPQQPAPLARPSRPAGRPAGCPAGRPPPARPPPAPRPPALSPACQM